jgi:hydrogenase maturation protease
MNRSLVERIADAVLYEGYILYPYRPSAVKNQQRWNFGALCPRSYSEAQGGTEAWTMQTECLVQGNENAKLDVKVRFLHLLTREVCELNHPLPSLDESIEPDCRAVPSLEVNGQLVQTWQEAVERDVQLPCLNLGETVEQSRRVMFSFQSSREIEPLRDEKSGQVIGIINRTQQSVGGAVEVKAERVGEKLLKLTIRILNATPLENAAEKSRDDALIRSLVSTHTILGVREGEFVSLLDPPEAAREIAASCQNIGTYPVLIGEEGERGCMLSSPIILYDYPQIAPESVGDLFDGTEIDEILTLRIMTLTEEEKHEMRGADERARQILERTETLPLEQLMKMHGAMKNVK